MSIELSSTSPSAAKARAGAGVVAERRWFARTVHGSASATTWDSRREITARPTEIWTERRVQTPCASAAATDSRHGRMACYRRESASNVSCLAEEPSGKYRVLVADADGFTRFSCLRFVLRSVNVVHVYKASLSDINEDRLCYDESLLRDDWLWTAADTEEWTYCSMQGGFDFVASPIDSDERLCSDSWRPSDGNGMHPW